ncbi:hypothetical protein C2E25_11725 [Geothermobacter hydrogeniphilus]|uniref:Methyl-accepting transducer domain-containing protein n=2 Tax=Geothermobacter hydrogeniphilus TaxID=1969733 RepID=A0A2K2H8L3_9BACT|nr:hypothetical protein C2E25_11725 [Geothermobacter hydrogeniphilus]
MIDEHVRIHPFQKIEEERPPHRPTSFFSPAAIFPLLAGALPGLTWAILMTTAPAIGPALMTICGTLAVFGWQRRQLLGQWQQTLREELAQQQQHHRQQLAELRRQQIDLIHSFHAGTHLMGQSLDPREVMLLAAENLHKVFGFDRVNLLLLNECGTETELAASHGSPTKAINRPLPFDHRAGILKQCADQRRALLVDDIVALPAELHLRAPLAELPQLRSRSFIVCPIISRGQPVALFGVDNKQRRIALDQADLETVQLFANQVSALIDRLTLLDRSDQLARALRDTFSELARFRDEYLQLNQALHEETDNAANTAGKVTAAAQTTGERVTETCSATQEISTTAAQLSENMTLLAEHMERVAGISAEMSAASGEIDRHADQSRHLSETVRQEANIGVAEIEKTLAGLHKISGALDAGEITIARLTQLGDKIEQMVTSIHDINDRTSLLALNAAIIAAQAGDHGRPFAIVADEIRALAGETNISAAGIETLVGQITRATRAMTDDFRKTRTLVNEELRLGEQTSGRLDSILNQATLAGEMAEKIRHATSEQADGSLALNQTISELKDLSSQCLLAIREQARGTRRIVVAMDEVESQTANVTIAAECQQQGTRQISRMTGRINAMAGRIFAALRDREQEGRLLIEQLAQMRRQD